MRIYEVARSISNKAIEAESKVSFLVAATIQVQVKEVFRSGNLVVYEKIGDINQ